MEAQPSDPSAAADYPRWVMLDCHGYQKSTFTADAKTVAAARTSTGDPIRVSFRLAAPPAASRLYLDSPEKFYPHVVAAHGNSVLIALTISDERGVDATEFLVYNAGAATDPSRPPTLSLLPTCYVTTREEGSSWPRPRGPRRRYMDRIATALLRRGDDEFLVAELQMTNGTPKVAELCLFSSGEWEVKQVPIHHDDGTAQELSSWSTDEAVSVGDRLLCWVDYLRGVMFYDVLDESPGVRYVPLPVEPPSCDKSGCGCPRSYRSVGVTGGGAALKFVDVFDRCCCGGPGTTFCPRSRYAFTITTWTLRMDDMTWVIDGVVDADELWALDGYEGLPRVRPEFPVVSMDDPQEICFQVSEHSHVPNGDESVWLIQIDMRSKAQLRSVTRNYEVEHSHLYQGFLPSEVSNYLNSTQSSSSNGTSASRSHKDIEPPAVADMPETDDVRGSFRSSCESADRRTEVPEAASPKEILAALQEIPDLARGDMLRAYSVLIRDARLFTSLVVLPMELRKVWLLMEIGNKRSSFVSFPGMHGT